MSSYKVSDTEFEVTYNNNDKTTIDTLTRSL